MKYEGNNSHYYVNERSRCFMWKKYILCMMVVINIAAMIHYSIYVTKMTDQTLQALVKLKPDQYVRTTVIV